jgi:hypothetical protein
MALKANCYALYELFYTYAPEIVPLCHNLVIECESYSAHRWNDSKAAHS